jgi:hypothetical protein
MAALPQNNKVLSLAFVGTIYNWHPWKSFLIQFSKVVEASEIPMQLNFYGINIAYKITDFIKDFPEKTKRSIHISPRMANHELLEQLAKNSIMVLFNDYSIIGTKIYDYLGIQREIILCYSNDKGAKELKEKYYSLKGIEGLSTHLQEDLLKLTNGGTVIENEDELPEVLFNYIEEFTKNGKIACRSEGVENYSRTLQIQKLAAIIKTIA